MISQNEEYISKKRAIDMWESSAINEFEVCTVEGLKQIHYSLFHDLEGFNAGQIREVDISKDGFLFAKSLYLNEALKVIENMPETNYEEIIDKYAEMNVAHPFIEGNGRSNRIWLDNILKENLNMCVDWQKINKRNYLDAMKLSHSNTDYLKILIKDALTYEIDEREVFLKSIDQSYNYEGLNTYSTENIMYDIDENFMDYDNDFEL